MLGEVFLFSQFSVIEIKILLKKLYSFECIDSSKSILKKCFTSNQFFENYGSLKVANLANFWTKLCALDDFSTTKLLQF